MTNPQTPFGPLTPEEKAGAGTQNKKSDKDEGIAILPVPDDVPREIPHHWLGSPVQIWGYLDANGKLLQRIGRFDKPIKDGQSKPDKDFFPLTYRKYKDGSKRWDWKGLDKPRPLYGLDKLAARPDAPVIVCEGEKSADAAQKLFPEYVAVTSPNGSGSQDYADWMPLQGRRVIIWPDNAQDGRDYAAAVAQLALEAGAVSVFIVQVPDGFPEKWDLADKLPEGFEMSGLQSLLDAAVPYTQTDGSATNDAWPDPKPIQAPLLPVLPFDGDTLLPNVLQAFVSDTADRMPCPPDFVAAAVVVALGSLIGARCAIKPKSKDDWIVIPNLWGGIVGSPSAKKSPAITPAFKPLDRLVAQALAEHEKSMTILATDNIIHEAQKAEITGRLKDAVKPPKKTKKGETKNDK